MSMMGKMSKYFIGRTGNRFGYYLSDFQSLMSQALGSPSVTI